MYKLLINDIELKISDRKERCFSDNVTPFSSSNAIE